MKLDFIELLTQLKIDVIFHLQKVEDVLIYSCMVTWLTLIEQFWEINFSGWAGLGGPDWEQ